MFRLISTSTGVAYHDFLLTRSPDGRLGLEDVYMLNTGEMLSQTLRRLLLPAAAEMNRGILDTIKGTDKTFVNNLPKVQSMAQAVQAGKGGEAVAIYRSLPAELRTHKVVALHHVQAASLVGDDDYAAAIQEYRRRFPNDPAIDFLSIDYFLLKKQYDEAIRCIRSVATAVGGDPYLLSMEGTAQAEAGRFKEAKAVCEKAVAEEPTLTDAYWNRISVALKEKNHPDTLAWLKKIVEKCEVEIDDLTKADDYADFAKSPQHAEWVKWYVGRKKE
jgi:tetratricopeptide (TPR) repeat protein